MLSMARMNYLIRALTLPLAAGVAPMALAQLNGDSPGSSPPPDRTCGSVCGIPPSADAPPEVLAQLRSRPVARIVPARDRGPGLTFDIQIVNPTGPIAPYVPGILSNLSAACQRWAGVLAQPAGPRTITVNVELFNGTRAGGRSRSNGFVAFRDNYNVYMQGFPYEAQTGIDPNGSAEPDVDIYLELGYLANELWFDPNPLMRTAPVPTNRTDAVSVFLHELGHAAAFNGWMNWATGQLPGNYRSTFDELTNWSSGTPMFQGPAARARYDSADVPLTAGNVFHLGNAAPGPGSNLILDLMNGVVFYRGARYDLSRMTLAVAQDANVQLRPICDGDFNLDGVRSVQDIFDFLSAWFANDLRADANADATIGVQDIFDFLAAWFVGC